jgi:hypothetical protein
VRALSFRAVVKQGVRTWLSTSLHPNRRGGSLRYRLLLKAV